MALKKSTRKKNQTPKERATKNDYVMGESYEWMRRWRTKNEGGEVHTEHALSPAWHGERAPSGGGRFIIIQYVASDIGFATLILFVARLTSFLVEYVTGFCPIFILDIQNIYGIKTISFSISDALLASCNNTRLNQNMN